jgi:hypothetical protein
VLIVALLWVARQYLPGEARLGLIGGILVLGAVFGVLCLETERRRAAAVTFAVTALTFVTSLFGWAAMRVSRHQENQTLLAAIAARGGDPQVGAIGNLEPSLIFYGQRPIQALEPAPAPSQSLRHPWDPRPSRGVREFFDAGRDHYIITTEDEWRWLQGLLPPTATILAECPILFKKEHLLLIGRADEAAPAAERDKTCCVLDRR